MSSGGNSISKGDFLWPGTETPGGLGELGSKSFKELQLENKASAMERLLRQSENICSAQKEQIDNLHWDLCKANRSIKNLEHLNSRIKVVLAVLGILFALTLIMICFPFQSNDLFVSYYTVSKNSLNALVTNSLFRKFYI